ncbi:hypothetical protein LV84_03526 [Algoriphagus ratkowskyi]|uniref:Uncharacterized protein n=1 Tax=Algoriphagus ratkowskyi TaxID=57028 RepID=A0A2W7R8W0_9BACT|nr:hypothetical protein LV84_03526 [Algoriphagus ratkowskyi]
MVNTRIEAPLVSRLLIATGRFPSLLSKENNGITSIEDNPIYELASAKKSIIKEIAFEIILSRTQ